MVTFPTYSWDSGYIDRMIVHPLIILYFLLRCIYDTAGYVVCLCYLPIHDTAADDSDPRSFDYAGYTKLAFSYKAIMVTRAAASRL